MPTHITTIELQLPEDHLEQHEVVASFSPQLKEIKKIIGDRGKVSHKTLRPRKVKTNGSTDETDAG